MSTRAAAASPHPITAALSLDPATFRAIRRAMELDHFKWDAQIGDESTLAPFPLLISPATWDELAGAAERLSGETLAAERELLGRPYLQRLIAAPRRLRALRAGGAEPTPAAARILRFDFHWTTEGWRVSEVNSDVPRGVHRGEQLHSSPGLAHARRALRRRSHPGDRRGPRLRRD